MNTESNPNAGVSILVVDDLPANLQLLSGILKQHGFEVRLAPSGALGLQAAQRDPPALILLDVHMPGLNGYEVCERLKQDAALQAIPVIFISGLGETVDKVRGFKVGGVDYVTKPFQFEEVEARVRTHLELARLRRELQQHNARLESLVARRTCELAEANARLSILDQAKSDFLNLISHEVRTPLCGVFAAAELLLAASAQDAQAAEYASLYEQSRRRLMTLIDDALLLTQIDAGAKVEGPGQCRLEQLLKDALAQAAPLAQSRRVELGAPPPNRGLVRGTADFLVRALQSLLETALQFARAGTRVRLAPATIPGTIGLVIEADGRAIPPEALPRFFDLLALKEPLLPGVDLGLAPALAERILTLYGGMASVENLEPPGIRLTIRFNPMELIHLSTSSTR